MIENGSVNTDGGDLRTRPPRPRRPTVTMGIHPAGNKKPRSFLKKRGRFQPVHMSLLRYNGWSRANGLSDSAHLYHDWPLKSKKNRKTAARFFRERLNK